MKYYIYSIDEEVLETLKQLENENIVDAPQSPEVLALPENDRERYQNRASLITLLQSSVDALNDGNITLHISLLKALKTRKLYKLDIIKL